MPYPIATKPGEYTKVSVATEVWVNVLAWFFGSLIGDAGLIFLAGGLIFIGWQCVGWPQTWAWFVGNWKWFVAAAFMTWPTMAVLLIGRFMGELWFKDPHRERPRGAFWGFVLNGASALKMLSDTSNSYKEIFGRKDNEQSS